VSGRRSPTTKGTALFVHGLWMTGAESLILRRHLAAHGWRLAVLPYSSLAEPLDAVARRCAHQVQALARRTLLPVHLIGHSLGGLVIYRVFELGLLPPARFSGEACRVVFMGTPVRGSQSARVLNEVAAVRALLGRTGRKVLSQGVVPHWPFAPQLGTIAGTSGRGLGRVLAPFNGPNDGTVAVAETLVEGAADHCELPVSHVGLWMSNTVAERVATFLDTGSFSRR
jgi:pimeloyl-ACP methyl ester carboxylesterase